ncbi:MAG: SGNH/GDSL hydrolase family protein [Pseudomonadota bacterium]
MKLCSLLVGAAVLAAASVTSAGPASPWLPSWYAAPAASSNETAPVKDLTLRQIVRVTAGGKQVRVTLSNAYGKAPLHINSAYVAAREDGATTKGPAVKLRFNGADDVTIAPGAFAVSDAVAFAVKQQSDLAVSLYVAEGVAATGHLTQRSAIYFAKGDVAAEAHLNAGAGPDGTWGSNLFVTEVEVSGSSDKGLVVAYGDSITDGMNVAGDAGRTWPDRLYERLHADHRPLAVINAGLSGNRLTRPPQWAPFGEMGVSRFDRDALNQPNLRHVIVMLGINDIGQTKPGAWDYAPAEEIEKGLAQLIERAHAKQVKLYLATLAPFRGAKDGYFTEDKEKLRQAVNAWIRTDSKADGVADFDKALDDPAHPGQLKPADDSGDHLHPNANGAADMADAIPLAWFH